MAIENPFQKCQCIYRNKSEGQHEQPDTQYWVRKAQHRVAKLERAHVVAGSALHTKMEAILSFFHKTGKISRHQQEKVVVVYYSTCCIILKLVSQQP